MRITILANRDLASNFALNILTGLLEGHELTVFLSDRVGKSSNNHASLKHLEICEQSLFLKFLSPSDSKRGRLLLSFDELSQERGCSVETLNKINTGVGFNRFVATNPELVVTIRYGVILKDPVISVPKFGAINLHSGLLPDYKGVMATFRAMLNKEATIGTTLHYIRDSAIDQGPVIGTTQLSVNEQKSYLWHVISLYPDGCGLIERSVAAIDCNGGIDAIDQTSRGHYYTFPTDSELREFEKSGLKLFDGNEILELVEEYFETCRQVYD